MKYWGFLAAKLAAGAGIANAAGWAIHRWYSVQPRSVLTEGHGPSENDLGYAFVMLGHTFVTLAYVLFCLGLVFLIVRDQRYRCRTCLRRLRMPIETGSWTHILLGPPRMEYICPYGHGTLKVPELHIGGPHPPDWQAHEDIWKELFTEETKR